MYEAPKEGLWLLAVEEVYSIMKDCSYMYTDEGSRGT